MRERIVRGLQMIIGIYQLSGYVSRLGLAWVALHATHPTSILATIYGPPPNTVS